MRKGKETEITVQVFQSLEEIDRILKKQGFFMVKNYHITDLYFSKFQEVEKLPFKDLIKQSFLIRKIGDTTLLCYKNKEYDEIGTVLFEEKISAPLPDIKSAAEIFLSAGLNNYCTVENETFVYQKNGICFAVQSIKDLGNFIEYEEDDTMDSLSPNEKIAVLSDRVKALNLKLGDDFSCKKVLMLLNR